LYLIITFLYLKGVLKIPQKFFKYLDKSFQISNIKLDKKSLFIELECKFPENNAKIDKGTLPTLEYYLDKDLYNISMSALKEAMQKKAIPYVPL